MTTDTSLAVPVGIGLVLYVLVMFAIGFWARSRVTDAEDFVVAGRRLGYGLATFTLVGTWFGAGTMLAATDEVRATGLQAAGLDPFGAGVCLILAGLLLARPLWRMKLLTVADFFRERYGPRAEVLAALLTIPAFLGWIAAQFVALAGVLNIFFGIPLDAGIVLVAAVGLAYTLAGGMWAVAVTDAVQLSLLLLGLVVMAGTLLLELGQGTLTSGLGRVVAETPAEKLALIPTETLAGFVGWLGLFIAGSFGNLPGQDLMQRVFASRSERVAQFACIAGGVLYVSFGTLPLLLGLAGDIILPEDHAEGTIALLAHLFLTPAMAVVFTITLISAVLSTIDSALLAPATTLAENVLHRAFPAVDTLKMNRLSLALICGISVGVALLGENAYSLLESSYELGLVSLLAPLLLGVHLAPRREGTALAAMAIGTTVWFVHQVAGLEDFAGLAGWPVGLCSGGIAFAIMLFGPRAPSEAAVEG